MRLAAFLVTLLLSSPAWAIQQVFVVGRTGTNLNAAAVRYANFVGGDTPDATQANMQSLIPDSGIVYDLRVTLTATSDNGAGSDDYAFVLMTGASTTLLTCTVSDGTTCTDLINVAAVTAGSLLSWRVTPANTPAAVGWRLTCKYVSNTTGNTILLTGSEGVGASTTVNNYLSPITQSLIGASEFENELLVPTAGTLKNLYVQIATAPGVGASWLVTARKNESGTALTCTITHPATTCSDLTNSFTVVAGDSISIEFNPSDGTAPAASVVYDGMVFVPNVDGEFIVAGTTGDTLNGAATEYGRISTAGNSYNATETVNQQSASTMVIKSIYVEVSADPDNGAGTQSYAFTLDSSAATPTAATCTISQGATTCNLTGLAVPIVNDAALSTSIVPANTPLSTITANISYLGFIAPQTDIMEY